MKKSILYILTVSLALPAFITACSQNDILYDVDFNVTLAPENTYYVGDPVTFNFDGEVDNILFFSGESGHEYRFKDRYSIPLDQIESATLHLDVWPRYGKGSLSVWYSSSFTGLNGNDGEADRTTMANMESGGMSGWTSVYTSAADEASLNEGGPGLPIPDVDVTEALENFSLAFLWNHDEEEIQSNAQRHYRVNGSLSITAEGIGTVTTDLSDFIMTTVMMNEEVDPYYKNAGNAFKWQYDGRWTPEKYAAGETITYPRATYNATTTSHNFLDSDYWMIPNDHFKLKNIELGYTLPSRLLKKAKISSVRFYATGNNVYTFFSRLKKIGIDPETKSTENYSYVYPITSTFILGVTIQY